MIWNLLTLDSRSRLVALHNRALPLNVEEAVHKTSQHYALNTQSTANGAQAGDPGEGMTYTLLLPMAADAEKNREVRKALAVDAIRGRVKGLEVMETGEQKDWRGRRG